MLATSKSVQELLESAFKRVDKDKSGFLEKEELGEILTHVTQCLGLDRPTTQDIADVMRELDRNGDERLSKEEFHTLIAQVLDIIFKDNKVRYEVIRDEHSEKPK